MGVFLLILSAIIIIVGIIVLSDNDEEAYAIMLFMFFVWATTFIGGSLLQGDAMAKRIGKGEVKIDTIYTIQGTDTTSVEYDWHTVE